MLRNYSHHLPYCIVSHTVRPISEKKKVLSCHYEITNSRVNDLRNISGCGLRMPMVCRLFYMFQLSSTSHCLLGSVICFTGGYRRFRVDVSSYLEGTVVKFADREQVVDDMIGVIGVTAL